MTMLGLGLCLASVASIIGAFCLSLMSGGYAHMSESIKSGGTFTLNAADEERAREKYRLALELIGRGYFDEAAKYLDESEEFLATSGIENLRLSAAIRTKQAICHHRGSRIQPAEELGRLRSFSIYSKQERCHTALVIVEHAIDLAKMSNSAPILLDGIFTRAAIRMDAGRYSDCEDDLRCCLDMSRKLYGEDSVEVGRLYSNLGSVLFEQGEGVQALEAYAEAVRILEKASGADDKYTIYARKCHFDLFRRLKEF